jgi:oligoribonuclease
MTGLDLQKDQIIEIAVVVTDQNLKAFDQEGFQRVIHCTKEKLENMSKWCVEQHSKVTPNWILAAEG